MIPTLFAADYIENLTYSGNYPTFPKHGYVDLVDTIECKAVQTEDEGSEWELEMTYPVSGKDFAELEVNKIILAKANSWQPDQAFRIYSIKKATDLTVTVKAQHIGYDMSNYPIKNFTVKNSSGKKDVASKAINNLMTETVESGVNHHFFIETNVDERTQDIGKNPTEYKNETPDSMRAVLLDGEDSIKGKFGGDLIWDNYHVRLVLVGGEDRDVTINYGIDLIDMEQENNLTDFVTNIIPYYKKSKKKGEGYNVIYGSSQQRPASDEFDGEGPEYAVTKTVAVDLTEYIKEGLTTDKIKEALNKKAQEYILAEDIGVPKISLKLSYAQLGQDVRMHDAIRIRFPKMRVDTKAKVVKYTYNVLLEQMEEVEVGHARDSKYFSLMDASRLRRGLVPPKRIQNRSIGGGKIEQRGIEGDNIGLNEIYHDLLSGEGDDKGPAVETDNIANSAVKTDKISSGNVTEAKIEPAVITRISNLEADVAYVNKLFSDSAQITVISAVTVVATNIRFKGYNVRTDAVTIGSNTYNMLNLGSA